MEVALVGTPNVGKSTLFNALTLQSVPTAPYPFTTVKANQGSTHVRYPCPHVEKGTPCTPGNSGCEAGVRTIPVRLVDVAGLVPGAHEGRGLGNQFLDDLRAADGFLQVVDVSGSTDTEGVLGNPGSHDPAAAVKVLDEELVLWAAGILDRQWDRQIRALELSEGKVEDFIQERMNGLSIPAFALQAVLRESPLDQSHPARWTSAERVELCRQLLHLAKPRLVVANKADRASSADTARLTEGVAPIPVQPASAEMELLLRRAAKAGLISYRPGDATFTVTDPAKLSPAQAKALDGVKSFLAVWGSTGTQKALEDMVFGSLHRIPIFPVEDESKWTDGKGRVLPDVHLVPTGTTARQFAYRVHSDLGEGFIRAVDGRTHRALGADHVLQKGDVVRIVSRK